VSKSYPKNQDFFIRFTFISENLNKTPTSCLLTCVQFGMFTDKKFRQET